MPRPRLLTKRGKLVKEWTVKPAELKALLKVKAPRAEKIKTRALRIEKSKLRVAPTQFGAADLMHPERWWESYFCGPLYRVRKNQKNVSPIEWQRFIHAIEALADSGMPSPTYANFVQVHINAMTMSGMAWGVHSMNSDGRNFLAWHREYLARIEARLIAINPLVTIPYWDWVTDRTAIPAALTDPADIAEWGITRGPPFNGNSLASASKLNALLAGPNFNTFQTTLEIAPGFHNQLHQLVGGTMMTSASPADPLFWLHHAFIDKIWADWQLLHPGVNPSNPTEKLVPPPMMRTVAQVLDTRALGYIYA